MTILDHDNWMTRTRRGPLTPRSAELKAIDRALLRYKSSRLPTRLIDVKKALDAWITKKGGNWKNSTRNTDKAVEALQAELNQRVGSGQHAHAVAHVRLAPPPPVAHYHTMTDDNLVTTYVTHVKDCFKNHWDTTQPVPTGTRMLEGILNVHGTCRIPVVGIQIKPLPQGYNGFFDFATWTIQISDKNFSEYAMVYTDPPANTKPHAYFVTIAETLYHEARHCEQWWHIARYCVHGSTAAKVVSQLGIELSIATAAERRPMKHGDPLLDKTKRWFESVYGGARRGIVLHALGLKRELHPSPKITPNERGGGEIHQQYAGNLAEEVDAWAIQELVRAKF